MKDDEKQSKREDMQLPDEEDMDFEILDALEQLDQSSPQESPEMSDETIELNLDDDDMDFGDSVSEDGSSFSFDDSLREDLEQELLQGDIGFDIDTSLEDDLVKEIQADTEGDSFDLDLDLDKELASGETEAENTEPAFDMSAAETLAFKFNKQDRKANRPSLEDEGSDDIDSYDLDLGSEDDDIDLESFSSQDDDFPELDLGIEGVEINEDFADLGKDIDLDSPLDSLTQESEDERIPGKAVITVGDDEVIDLGDEEQLRQEQPPEPSAPMTPPTVEAEEKQPPELEEEENPSVPEVALDLHEEDDEDLMNSLEDIAIDLKEDINEPLEESDIAESEEEPSDSENTDMADLVKEVLDTQDAEQAEEESEIPDMDEESGLAEEGDEPELREEEEEPGADLEEPTEEHVEETPTEEEDVDVREFLELSLRLSDQQIEEFETMVSEAKTLQTYLDELAEHHSDVKENIYHKLQGEYIARKTVIFKSEEFTSLLSDVEQDLEDMLAKRAEFVDTVERLNEELEEIKVRHLVGEYDDSTLAEKQESQNAEIALWNEKTEKIQVFITRYQESLDAEKALNPLRQEQEEAPLDEEPPQEEEAQEFEEINEPAEIPETSDTAPIVEETEGEEDTELQAEETAEEKSNASIPEPEEAGIPEAEAEPDIEDFFAMGGDASEEDDELDEEFPIDGEFETGDFVLDDLSGFEEDDDDDEEDASAAYEVTEAGSEEEETMVACSKCGRQTPAAEKFCVHCGGKAQQAEQDANVSCKKCGRQTPAAEKFCIHCGGKAQ